MRARLTGLLLVGLAGCGPQEVPAELGCAQEPPARLDAACNGDGECGSWLVCVEQACALPPAVSGVGGESVSIDAASAEQRSIQVEVARGDLQRERGLSGRPCIEEGWGLLIAFPQPGDHLITVERMRFNLDLALAGPDGVIHAVHRDAVAGGTGLFGATESVAYVLETRAGAIDLAAGDKLGVSALFR